VPAVLRITVISSVIASVTKAGSVEISGSSEGSGVGVGFGGLGFGGNTKPPLSSPQPNITIAMRAIIIKRSVFIDVNILKLILLRWVICIYTYTSTKVAKI
jgi:hypothetical protein